MAGFEVIVRPVIFPDIRPPPTRSLPPEDDPTKGLVVLGGSGGGLIGLTRTETHSFSKQHIREVKRVVDVERIKQRRPDGTVDEDNYIDVERVKKLHMQTGKGENQKQVYAPPPEPRPNNIEVIDKNVTIVNDDWAKGGGGAAP